MLFYDILPLRTEQHTVSQVHKVGGRSFQSNFQCIFVHSTDTQFFHRKFTAVDAFIVLQARQTITQRGAGVGIYITANRVDIIISRYFLAVIPVIFIEFKSPNSLIFVGAPRLGTCGDIFISVMGFIFIQTGQTFQNVCEK